jgi:hypothetical protein
MLSSRTWSVLVRAPTIDYVVEKDLSELRIFSQHPLWRVCVDSLVITLTEQTEAPVLVKTTIKVEGEEHDSIVGMAVFVCKGMAGQQMACIETGAKDWYQWRVPPSNRKDPIVEMRFFNLKTMEQLDLDQAVAVLNFQPSTDSLCSDVESDVEAEAS